MHIAVFASYSRDTVTTSNQAIVSDGGPARYIAEELDRLSVSYVVYSGEQPADVRISIVDGIERGSVDRVDRIMVPADITADASIVSTILNEFPLQEITKLPGLVALDIQGHVRRPGGKHEYCVIDRALWPAIDIVKATESELVHLDPEFIAAAKERTLLLTRGRLGAMVWDAGEAYDIPVKPVTVTHAVGAGDTFFAAFIVARLRGMDPMVAGRFASNEVQWILSKRS